jgi:hypothetical protein
MSIANAIGKLARNVGILAEGVGFEPTVGCPTLDFESSALNRTQPPFLKEEKRPALNVQHPISNAKFILSYEIGWAAGRRKMLQFLA